MFRNNLCYVNFQITWQLSCGLIYEWILLGLSVSSLSTRQIWCNLLVRFVSKWFLMPIGVTFAFDPREDQIRIAPFDGAFFLSLNAQGNNLLFLVKWFPYANWCYLSSWSIFCLFNSVLSNFLPWKIFCCTLMLDTPYALYSLGLLRHGM